MANRMAEMVYEGLRPRATPLSAGKQRRDMSAATERDGKILYVTSTRINIPLAVIRARTRRAIFHFNLERCDGSLSAPSMKTNNGKIYELRAEKVEARTRGGRCSNAEILRITVPLLFFSHALSRPSTARRHNWITPVTE